MSETVKTDVKQLNAFGHRCHLEKPLDLSVSKLEQFGVEIDKETGNTTIVVTGVVDIDELVQTYKDQCGMALALRLLKTGQASPDMFADDGQHSMDTAGLPDNIFDAGSQAAISQAVIDRISKQLGLEGLTADNFEEIIKAKVQEQIAAQAAAQAAKESK